MITPRPDSATSGLAQGIGTALSSSAHGEGHRLLHRRTQHRRLVAATNGIETGVSTGSADPRRTNTRAPSTADSGGIPFCRLDVVFRRERARECDPAATDLDPACMAR